MAPTRSRNSMSRNLLLALCGVISARPSIMASCRNFVGTRDRMIHELVELCGTGFRSIEGVETHVHAYHARASTQRPKGTHLGHFLREPEIEDGLQPMGRRRQRRSRQPHLC